MMSFVKCGPAIPYLSLTNCIRPTTGRIREGKEFNHLTKEEFPGASDYQTTREHSDIHHRDALRAQTSARVSSSASVTLLYEDATFMLYELINLWPQNMSLGVQPRGSSGE